MSVKPLAPRAAAPALARKRPLGYRAQRLIVRLFGWALLAVVILIALFPIYFMTITAFHPPSLSFSSKPTLFSTDLSLTAFRELLRQYPFLTWMRNSLLIAVLSTVFAVSVSTFAAYSLSRLRYPGRRFLSSAVFLVYLFPSTLLFIPIFILLSDLRLLNSFAGLIAVYLTFTIPFSVWMLKAYFLNIPRDLEDAALVDGATRWQAMTRVVLPLARPGIAAAAIYAFTLAWNEYLYAFTLLSDSAKFTLAPGMTKLVFGDVFLWGMIMAGGFLMSLPILLLYFFAQRFLVAGLTAGSVKG
ncbi:MAG: carbohydrate ABC transporter permease [Chloroflexota bacterium]|nr:carbohydrate ABC transporter permease [Chloroflexota bacterium]